MSDAPNQRTVMLELPEWLVEGIYNILRKRAEQGFAEDADALAEWRERVLDAAEETGMCAAVGDEPRTVAVGLLEEAQYQEIAGVLGDDPSDEMKARMRVVAVDIEALGLLSQGATVELRLLKLGPGSRMRVVR